MTELDQVFDSELWRWELVTGAEPGPAGVAAVSLVDGVVAYADALDQRLLGLVVDAVDPGGLLDDEVEESLRVLGLAHPIPDRTSQLADDVGAVVSRLAVLHSEYERSEAAGPSSDAWSAEATSLRQQLGLRVEPSATGPSDGGALSDAQEAFVSLPPVVGGVAEDGPVWVDPSWLSSGVLDVRRTRTRAVPGDGAVSVGTGFRAGIYVAAVTGISAVLVEDATGIVVGVSSFQPDGDAARLGASSRVVVGRGRPVGSLSLWMTSDVGRPPSARLRVARQATELARRAAQADRLGMGELARPLLDQSNLAWSSIGRTPRTEPGLPSVEPYAGEVADLAALLQDGTT